MRSRIYTIIRGHFKSWYRSKSNIFWTIAFPLLLIVLFGAIFGSGSTKFDLYLQNQDLSGNVPTPLSQGYVNVLNQTGAFNLHMVAAEQPDPGDTALPEEEINRVVCVRHDQIARQRAEHHQ